MENVKDGAKPLRVVLYSRVSTMLQTVENQLLPLRQHAAARGYEVVAEIKDVGISGTKSSRPGLNRVMDMARKRQVDAVLVFKFDRFARSVKHLLDALQEFRRLGVQFISYSENIDTSTALGECLFAIVGAMAQLERGLIVERVQAGLARAVACGVRLGRPPLDVDPVRVAEVYAQVKSIRLTSQRLSISPSSVQRLLKQAARGVPVVLDLNAAESA